MSPDNRRKLLEITLQSSRLNTKVPIAIVAYDYRKALQLGKAVVKHVLITNTSPFFFSCPHY